MKKLNFKNLESLKNEKFSISKEEQNQILGGYGGTSRTYEFQDTMNGDEADCKKVEIDACYQL